MGEDTLRWEEPCMQGRVAGRRPREAHERPQGDREVAGTGVFQTVCAPECLVQGPSFPLQTPPMCGLSCQGTTLFTNLSSVLKDQSVWKEPFRFRPEHFLDAQGRFVKPAAFMPFSAGACGVPSLLPHPEGAWRDRAQPQAHRAPYPPTGRRSCLGEPLARMELFLFFTCLLQRFSFSVPAGQPRPSDHGTYAFLVAPPPFQLCALPR